MSGSGEDRSGQVLANTLLSVFVGSGAVVTENVPAGVVAQGNPATVVRELE